MTKYILFIPEGGFNDIMCILQQCIHYAKIHNRIILFEMRKSCYKINFANYFNIHENNIIYNSDLIKKICLQNNNSVYPNVLKNKLNDIITNKISIDYINNKFIYNNKFISIPRNSVNEKVIVYITLGGGNGFNMFKKLSFKNNIKNYCKIKHSLLENKYLCIQVRNTDFKCKYEDLYEKNKALIHSYKSIYIATDNKIVVDFFKSKDLNVFNFCKFPDNINNSHNLHYSNIDPDSKIKSLICDLYIASMSDRILSISKGCFIKLLQNCFKHKKFIENKFL